MEKERGVIIALQGDPSTGKTTIANILGRALKLSTLHLDDILDLVAPGPKPTRQSTKAADALFTRAFDILTQLVKSQTRLGLSVVVDSPLSRRIHLDKLLDLLTGEAPAALRLLIVHCIPQTEYIWESELRSHISSRYKDKWYKPQIFPIHKAYIRDYKDSHIPTRLVSRLVVETNSHLDVLPPDPLVELVRRMSTSPKDRIENLQSWMMSHGISPTNIKRPGNWDDGPSMVEGRPRKRARVLRAPCTDGHCVKEYHKEGGFRILSRVCEACGDKIIDSEAVYSCTDCSIAIHKACAELGDEVEYSPDEFPKFIHRELHKASYCFLKQHSCSVCIKDGKEFSYDCGSCVFKSHLKSAELPTILRHKAHPQHQLYFWLRPISNTMPDYFQCYACRKLTNYVGFSCTGGCVNYHPECAVLPRVFKMHWHGGHQHDLSLVFHRKEMVEDYICNACNETLNPDAWFYACFKCQLEMHLDCAFKEYN